MSAFLIVLVAHAGLAASGSPDAACTPANSTQMEGLALMQQKKGRLGVKHALLTDGSRFSPREFLGASPVASADLCTSDSYQASKIESGWSLNALDWTQKPCEHLGATDTQKWIHENQHGSLDPELFSTVCRKGKLPQFIEPLAGILRDPRFLCPSQDLGVLFSVDWLVFPDSKVLTAGGKSRFFDAGGSHFNEALSFLLGMYTGHGIVFDEVYVWEFLKQGTENYWMNVDNETRAFWEPRVKFYDGIGVTAEKDHEHNPVSRIFNVCAPEDYCAFKLDIDTPQVETPLYQQLLEAPAETQAKLDEFFFEHHVKGVMQPWWGELVDGTFADSYKLFGELRKLGVRAHSWV